jgi:hypothetical protein
VSLPPASPGGQYMSLPPPPPGMAYLVPRPGHEEQQQQSPAVAEKQCPDMAQKTTGVDEEVPELNARFD